MIKEKLFLFLLSAIYRERRIDNRPSTDVKPPTGSLLDEGISNFGNKGFPCLKFGSKEKITPGKMNIVNQLNLKV